MRHKATAPRGLVAVSDPEARAAAARALETSGYAVEASSEWTATMAKVGSGAFNVVIAGRRARRLSCSCGTAEVEMPVVGGFDVLKAIRYNHPRTLVFLLGRNGNDDDVKHARDLGAAAYVRTPVDEHDLSVRVKAARDEIHNRRVLLSLGIKGGRLRPVG